MWYHCCCLKYATVSEGVLHLYIPAISENVVATARTMHSLVTSTSCTLVLGWFRRSDNHGDPSEFISLLQSTIHTIIAPDRHFDYPNRFASSSLLSHGSPTSLKFYVLHNLHDDLDSAIAWIEKALLRHPT